MTVDQANTALAVIKEQREKYDSQKKGKKGKAITTGDEDKRESSDKGEKENPENEGSGPSGSGPEKSADKKADDKSTQHNATSQPEDSDDSDDSSSSSDNGDDPRKRTSHKDKESVRGRTPRVKTENIQARNCSRWTLRTSILAIKIPIGLMQRYISS